MVLDGCVSAIVTDRSNLLNHEALTVTRQPAQINQGLLL